MARIKTLASMRSYIKMQLGAPVIKVEMADTQIDQIIEDCIQTFQDYHTGEGNYLDYLPFTVSAGVPTYNVSASNIASTIDFELSNSPDGINVLFSPTHNLLYQDWVIHGNYPGGSGAGQGNVLTNFEIQTQYIEDIRDSFGAYYYAQYSDSRQEVTLTPTPELDGTGLMVIYRKESAENLYNNHLVKRLCVAKSKMLWGEMLSKYSSTIPGGATINGESIFSRGQAEYDRVLDDMIKESEPPYPFVE